MTLRVLLERLIDIQSNPQSVNEEEFKKLQQEISKRLSTGHLIRFNRLSFFSSESKSDYLNDIPF